MNNHQFIFSLILILLNIYPIISTDCEEHPNGDDTPFSTKVQQSPLVLMGTSLNKNFDKNIPNLFNVTFLVRCILKGSPTQRIIRIVQAGSLLGRRSCQKFDVNRQYIAFLEPFFDDTYRPVDFEEVLYTSQVDALLEKTCGLIRTYPFTESDDIEARYINKCPLSVSLGCPLVVDTSTVATSTSTRTSLLSMTSTVNSLMFGKSTIDFGELSLLLSEHQHNNLSFSFLEGQSHKSLFSDDETRKNQAQQFTTMLIINFVQFLFCSLLYLFP